MTIDKIVEGVWRLTLPTPFSVGPVNTYLIKTDRWTLVDAGVSTDDCYETLAASLSELNLGLEDIDQVVLTHHHPDHIGLAGAFPKTTRMIGHRRLEPWFRQDEALVQRYEHFFRKMFQNMGIPEAVVQKAPSFETYFQYARPARLDATIDEGSTIDGLPGWKVLYTPGHAGSHISLLREEDGLFIGGDVLLEHISSNAVIEPPDVDGEEPPLTLLHYRETLLKLVDEPFLLTLPGHGDVFENGKTLIRVRLDKQLERRKTVYQLLDGEGMSAFEVGSRMFPKLYLKQLDLVMSEVIGFLRWLEADGCIKYEQDAHGTIRFIPVMAEQKGS